MPRQQRTGSRYRTLRSKVIADGGDCAVCLYPVDKDLDGRHPWGPSLHHVYPLRWGGAVLSGVLAHTGCNAAVRDAHPGSERYVRAARARRVAYLRYSLCRVAQGSGARVGVGVRASQSLVPTPSRVW